ncbi:hypothetical protein M1P56_22460 [Streptomyces sp. HU2014]|uniref:hypothetical protein n=1 Tax=Streptomyces sp. HU2014 TaxID=2939414 RepID=UPI0020106930|nr:hypothetical protein [Streptomyces sp. HU2014]UQI46916.1 hypothetical protein M1P56_22460 [Streptomyces sp. HU2014]
MLSLSLTACTSDHGRGATPQPSVERFTPLNQLKSINFDEGFPAPEDFPAGNSKAIGEVQKGPHHLIAYIKNGSCGLLVTDATKPERSSINITSAWPKTDSEGTERYPAGPYSFTSGAGANEPETWASLYCSKTAMVITYSSQGHDAASHQQGNTSTKEDRQGSSPLTVAIGSPEAREKILGPAT